MEPPNQNPTQPQNQQDPTTVPQVVGPTVPPQPVNVTSQVSPVQPSITVSASSETDNLPPAGKSNARMIGIVLVLLCIIVLVVLGFIFFGSKSKKSPAASNQANGHTNNQSAIKTYTGQFITLQYPSSWQVQADKTTSPPTYSLVPPNVKSPDYGLSINGEDNFTSNAKNNDPKTYYKTATSSTATAVTSNSNTINGNQAYSEEDTIQGSGNQWNVIVSKNGTKVWFSFYDGPNTAAYNKVIGSIKFK